MDWYYILFVVVFTIFIIKNIISWIAGEVYVDFDLDENIDYDISTAKTRLGDYVLDDLEEIINNDDSNKKVAYVNQQKNSSFKLDKKF